MGVDRTRKTMVKRIENMSYKGQWYRPEIEDVELITKHIRPGNGIHQGIVGLIANAWLDRMLGGNEENEALMSKDKTFEAEVNVAVENAVRREVDMSARSEVQQGSARVLSSLSKNNT